MLKQILETELAQSRSILKKLCYIQLLDICIIFFFYLCRLTKKKCKHPIFLDNWKGMYYMSLGKPAKNDIFFKGYET